MKHIGETFGIYTIVEKITYKSSDGHSLYKGICKECGYERIAKYNDFKCYITSKCIHVNINGEFKKFETDWHDIRLREIYNGIKGRCYNINNKSYKWYGAKGIKVCNEWINNPQTFNDWAISNGYKDGLTINRKDESKDYCPENCEWITSSDNSKYKSTTSLIEVDGEIHSGRDWSVLLGLGINTVNKYIRKYGLDNTIEFIKRFRLNPFKTRKCKNKSYYDLYMNDMEA